VAISRSTLALLRSLRVTIGAEADEAVRAITRGWVRAWDELAPAWRAAILDVVAQAAANQRWPSAFELRRIERLATSARASQEALIRLSREAGVIITDGAGRIIKVDADMEPRLIASQLPAAERPAALVRFAGRIGPGALSAIVARTTGQITSTLRPLSAEAYEAMQRALIQGIAVGDNPRTVARDMLARVEGAFNGGLSRAVVISRTEMLDAYRAASAYSHAVNSDVLAGWTWTATLDRRTCVSCWSMHGRTFPLDTPGPLDHQSGRCARCPQTRSWSDLGFRGISEPPSAMSDARAKFDSLPRDQQLAIMGPARLAALQSGRLAWDDLAVQRHSTGWRTSYVPVRVSDLPREAATGRPSGLVVAGSR
jgi:SPP1 gp7 family putative phage head morphogenesis protein